MATYIKTLKDENGDIVLPRTSKSAIQDVINEVPSGGTAGQVLTKTVNGFIWADAQGGGGGGGGGGTLNTNNTSAQTVPTSAEALSGEINLHKVSKTGSYDDLNDKPTLSTVATSGSYSDLTSKWSVVNKEMILEQPIGGRIYYDDGDNGATYIFYDTSGNVITDTSISGLANAVSYTISGTPTRDRFYVYDNTTHTTGNISASNGLVSDMYWGWYGTDIGSRGVPPYRTDTIGSGKLNTNAVLTKGVPTDYTPNIWAYIKSCRDNNLNGCNDWYINSQVEQNELIASGLVDWYSSNQIWSSVEQSNTKAYFWYYNYSMWDSDLKDSNFCCFAGRSF